MRPRIPPDPGFNRGLAYAIPPSILFWGIVAWLILKHNGAL